MGSLTYDRASRIDIDDRTLAHLQAVVFDKLRRGESFALDLQDATRAVTIWVSPRTPIAFTYGAGHRPALNRAWLVDMAEAAGVHGVLRLTREPSETEPS